MRIAAPLASLACLASATPAWACTLCYRGAARAVQAVVSGLDVWANAGAVLSLAPGMW